MNNKTLFLVHDSDDFFSLHIKKKGVHLSQIFWQKNIILRAVRSLHIKLKLPFISLWLGKWKKTLKYDIVVIPASILSPPVIKYINLVAPNQRIIVWFANPISNRYKIEHYQKLNCELWSFDKGNCDNFKMNHNTQYYFNTKKLPDRKVIYDVSFVGADKNRLKKLLEIEKQLNSLKLKSYFHITSSPINKKTKYSYKKPISYLSILEIISTSLAILEVLQENQSGLTLRALESLFFSKKLITNNSQIIDFDFYHKENIFILDQDDINNLPSFINSNYYPVDKEIIDKYDFNNWINRFQEKN